MVETNHNTTNLTEPMPGAHPVAERSSNVSWAAIFLGFIVAMGVQILLGLLGLGLGFAVIDPSDPMGGIGAWSVGAAIYVIVTQVISLAVGGYLAARSTRAHTSQSAIFHGASIWALATVAMVWFGTTTAGMAISGVSGAVANIASATSQAVKTVVPDDIDFSGLPEVDYLALPEPLRNTLRQNNISANQLQQEIRGAYRQVVTRQEQQQLTQELQQTAKDIMQSPADALEEIDQTIDEVFGQGGILSQEDLAELENTLQQRLNLSDQDVQQIVDQIQQTAARARENLKQALRTAKQQMTETAEAVTGKIASAAFWLFVASLLGLIAAVLGGKKGEVKTAW